MEETNLRERIGLTAESMLPPLSRKTITAYTAATAAALLISALPLLPL
ncbi:MAG TPA: hypothetical protein IAC04_08470 [Candidatus Coprenecus stercoravium]|uniref:Uncharacterized protein n=1 Tax=Candidatus Coprenecus stercoravium TaxID=2840735 RepID=A0A9D2KB04_9BACT|nr:hypothetical protein [Candidatus Coprenecus stercoravium]